MKKKDKLSPIKLNFIKKTSFFRSKYVKQIVTYKINNSNEWDKLSQKKLTLLKRQVVNDKIIFFE